MATRPDIRDFDVESLLKSFAAAKRGSRKDPSYLKQLAPNLIKGVIGVYDQYQTEKLQDEIDQVNFDNTLELAKLNMNAAKNAKLYKATSQQYNQLANQGFNFDEVDNEKISDAAFAAAQPILGEQAWRETTEKFKTIPQSLTGSYDDFEQYVQDYAVSPEAKQNITNFYRAAIKDQANYIKTGQSFNYDKFQAAAESLQAMDIDFDAADYGLLAKLDGRLRRKIRMRDGSIDTFRSTYMSKPAADMDNALSVWRDSRTKDDFNTNIQGLDLGYAALLTNEQRDYSVALPTATKERIRMAMEKRFGDVPNAATSDVQTFFNSLVYGSAMPTQAQVIIQEDMYREIAKIENDGNLTLQQKEERITNQRNRAKSLFNDIQERSNIRTPEDVTNFTYLNTVRQDSLAAIKVLKDKGNLTPEEQTRLIDTQQINQLATMGINAIGSQEYSAINSKLTEQILENMATNSYSGRGYVMRLNAYGNKIAEGKNGALRLNTPELQEAINMANARGDEVLLQRLLTGVAPAARYGEKDNHRSTTGQAIVEQVQLTFQNQIAGGNTFGFDDNVAEKLNAQAGFRGTGLDALGQVMHKADFWVTELQQTNELNILRGGTDGIFGDKSTFDIEAGKAMIPDMLIELGGIVYDKDTGSFRADLNAINEDKVFDYLKAEVTTAKNAQANIFQGFNVSTDVLDINISENALADLQNEVNSRGSKDQRDALNRKVEALRMQQAEAQAEKEEKERTKIPTQKDPDPRAMGGDLLSEEELQRRRDALAGTARRSLEILGSGAGIRNDKKKVIPEPTSPKETSETTVLDTVINTLIPSAEAVVPETQQTSLLEGDNISRAVDRADARQRNLFSNKKEIPVTLSNGTSLMVDTTKPVVYLKNKFDANELTFDQGVEAYAKAIEAHNATLGLTSKANALDPIVDSLTFAALANPKEYNPKRFIRVASNKKESQNFKDSVFEIVNGEKAQEEINQYSLKVSDMTDQQKEKEFERQAKRAKNVPVNSNNDYARNAIEYLKLQSIFGAENDRALPNLGKEEYGSTVNSKVSQYNDYLENYSPSMDSRLIQIYTQVANNLKSSNKNSLLASN
jgi:hypothetical protein